MLSFPCPSEDADRNRYIALQPLCLCCDRGPTVLGSIDRLLTFYLYGASFRITSHVRQKQREGDVPRRGSLLLGHRANPLSHCRDLLRTLGLPLILNFIVCGMALLTFFRQCGHSGSTGKQRRHRKQTECYCSANTALQASSEYSSSTWQKE